MRETSAEMDQITMTTSETTNRAAAVAEPGAHVAPVKASSKKGCQPEEGRAQGAQSRHGRQVQDREERREDGSREKDRLPAS
jgi:hypothetical protein